MSMLSPERCGAPQGRVFEVAFNQLKGVFSRLIHKGPDETASVSDPVSIKILIDFSAIQALY
jgi:hypothetical protein